MPLNRTKKSRNPRQKPVLLSFTILGKTSANQEPHLSSATFTLFEAQSIIGDSGPRRVAPFFSPLSKTRLQDRRGNLDLAAPAPRGYTAPDEEASEALHSP